jgi:hypothetical protein
LVDFVRYYWLERYLFEEVHQRFQVEHSISAFDLFSIVIWKANRAKSLMHARLRKKHGDVERAAREHSNALWRASSDQERLESLVSDECFRLPMASAILAVFWPDQFTIYDVRVCDELSQNNLGDFHGLSDRSPNRLWDGYRAYVAAVRGMEPKNLSLRDKDRYLWGRSAARQLQRELEVGCMEGATRPA